MKQPTNHHYEFIEHLCAAQERDFTSKPYKPNNSSSGVEEQAKPTTRPCGGRYSLDDHIRNRPLPPVPRVSVQRRSEYFKKYENSQSGSAKQSTISHRSLARTGSEPNLLDDVRSDRKLSASHSLEFLDADGPETEKNYLANSRFTLENTFLSLPRRARPSPIYVAACDNEDALNLSGVHTLTPSDGILATSAVELRPPPSIKPSREENHVRRKKNSTIRRQRPVNAGMRPQQSVDMPDAACSPMSIASRHPDTGTTHLVRLLLYCEH